MSSRPTESEATLSFAALGDLMDGLLGQVLPQLPPPQRRALEVALLIADPLGSPPASLSSAADLAGRIGLAEPAAWRFHANQVEAVIGLGDLDRAEGLLERLKGCGRATERAWTLATAARCRALLLAESSQHNLVAKPLEQAGHLGDVGSSAWELIVKNGAWPGLR